MSYLTNIPIAARSMNGLLSFSDGINTFEDGAISFSDGTTITSTSGLPTLSGSNTFSGSNIFSNSNTFSGNTSLGIITTSGVATLNSLSITNNGTISGTITVSGSTQLNNTLGVTGITSITNTTDSTSTTSGAVKISGGLGLAKSLYVGSDSVFSGSIRIKEQPIYFDVAGTDTYTYIKYYSDIGIKGLTISSQTNGQILNGTTSTQVLNWNSGTVTIPLLYDSGSSSSGSFVVSGGVGIGKKLYVGSNLSVSGTVTVTGATSLSTLSTSGLATLNSLTVTNNESIGGTLSVTGATSLSTVSSSGLATLNSLSVTGSTEFSSSVRIKEQPIYFDTAGTDTYTYIKYYNDIGIKGLTISSQTNGQILNGTTSTQVLNWNSGTVTIPLLYDSGSSSSGSFVVNGGCGICKKLYVGSNLSVSGTATVTGATSLSTLSTSGLATLNSLSVTNNESIGGTLSVTGATSLSTVSSSGLATLNSVTVTNNESIGGTLSVTGATSLSTVSSSGLATLNSLSVTNNESIGGTFSVTGVANFTSKIYAASGINSDKLVITESTGTSADAYQNGSLVIKHTDTYGKSSICFPSVCNSNSDYGYIQYNESNGSSLETGRMIIGIENDATNVGNRDCIILYSSGGAGYIGINTYNPSYVLDVNGDIHTNTNITADSTVTTLNLTVSGTTNSSIVTVGSTLNVLNGYINHEYNEGVSIGRYCLNSLSVGIWQMGIYNVGIGKYCLSSLTTANKNTAVGCYSSQYITGEGNTALGYKSLPATTTGLNNIGIGIITLQHNTSGNYNSAIGYQSGFYNSTSSYNTYVGCYSKMKDTYTKSYSTAIGYSAEITEEKQIVIGRANDCVTSIAGTLKLNRVHSNGSNAIYYPTTFSPGAWLINGSQGAFPIFGSLNDLTGTNYPMNDIDDVWYVMPGFMLKIYTDTTGSSGTGASVTCDNTIYDRIKIFTTNTPNFCSAIELWYFDINTNATVKLPQDDIYDNMGTLTYA